MSHEPPENDEAAPVKPARSAGRVRTHFNMSPAEYASSRAGHLEQRRLSMVRSALDRQDGPLASVLEIGSGTGTILEALASDLPQVEFKGIDIDERMVAYAQETHRAANLSYAVADITQATLGTRFDFVYSVDLIHHLHDHATGFAAVRTALRPGGTWMAVEPNIWHPYITFQQERMKRAGYDEDHLRPWQVEPLLHEAGFEIMTRRYAHLFPAGLSRVPEPLQRVERALERFRLLGGSVAYTLTAR